MSVRLSILTGVFVLLAAVSAAPYEPAQHTAAPDPHAAADVHATAPQPETAAPVSADDAIKLLVAGNERFVNNGAEHPRVSQDRRCDTFNNGQHPFAVVLACADSRAPVELLFDQGIGDLFVIRVAGNVADTDEIGTIEYGVGHLDSPLVVVLGHTNCGAVTAVVKGSEVGPNIAKLVDNIVPAAEQVKTSMPGLTGGALVQAVVDANVMRAMQDLLTHSEETRHLVSTGKVKVVGAVYDLHGGTVRWLGQHPRQAEFLGAPIVENPAEPQQLVHDTPPANPHGEPVAHNPEPNAASHEVDAHGAPAANDPHAAPADEHADPHAKTSSAEKKAAAPEASTKGGLLLPAAFIGGANAIGVGIIYFLKFRATKAPAPAT